MIADSDLKNLHGEKEWEEIVAYVKANKEFAEKDLEKGLVLMLDSIYELDQNLRLKSRSLTKEFGWGSDTLKSLWVKINYQDSLNELAITKLLDERGWLGPEIIGDREILLCFL